MPNYIEETIESALNQTHQKIEIIVVDDFSTNNSFKIVEAINSNKIKLVKNIKKKLGIVQAAGKSITDYKTKKIMVYNRKNLLNNWFIVK